jgi:hypothetical protein
MPAHLLPNAPMAGEAMAEIALRKEMKAQVRVGMMTALSVAETFAEAL